MTTVQSIARQAKVAPSTVSMVANGTGRISEKTRRRVQILIEKAGYKPRRARRPAAASGRNIGVFYIDTRAEAAGRHPIIVLYMRGINNALARAGIEPRLVAFAGQIDHDPVIRECVQPERLDGAIVVSAVPPADSPFFQHLRQADRSIVVINRRSPMDEFSSVSVDYAQGGLLASQHLIRHGHRRIGFVGLGEDHWPTAQRLRGHLQALSAAGVEAGPVLALGTELDRLAAVDAYCRRALDAGCTAMVMGDFHIPTLTQALTKIGRRVPQDLSIVGFDGLGVVLDSGLRLTSIGYDQIFLGELAVSTLLETIETGPNRKIHRAIKTVATHLVEGDTVSSPSIS